MRSSTKYAAVLCIALSGGCRGIPIYELPRVSKDPAPANARRHSSAPSNTTSQPTKAGRPGVAIRTRLGTFEIEKLLQTRHVLIVAGCRDLDNAWRTRLRRLWSKYRNVGLGADGVYADSCPVGHSPRGFWKASRGLYRDFGGMPGRVAIVVVDTSGAVLWRKSSIDTSDLDSAVEFLRRTWIPLRVVQDGHANTRARAALRKAQYLLGRAQVLRDVGRLVQARELLNMAVTLAPGASSARKELVSINARVGDLAGAAKQLHWWEKAYGGVAAENLRRKIDKYIDRR